MANRKQKIETLLTDLQALRRSALVRNTGAITAPRITPAQWGVLMYIEQRGGSTIKELAKALHISSSAATQLVDGLVENGYLKREASAIDRRTVMVTLSKKSIARVTKMKKQSSSRMLKIFAVLNEREFDQYLMLNKKITERFLSKRDL